MCYAELGRTPNLAATCKCRDVGARQKTSPVISVDAISHPDKGNVLPPAKKNGARKEKKRVRLGKDGEKKQVRFAPMARVVRVPSRSTIGEEVLSAAWYDKDHLRRIKDDAFDVKEAANRRSLVLPWASPPEELRGIEHWGNSEDCEDRRYEKQRVVREVVAMQAKQHRTGTPDSDAMAYTSRKLSRNARHRARQTGTSDAKAAEEILSEGRTFATDDPPPFLAVLAPELYGELLRKKESGLVVSAC